MPFYITMLLNILHMYVLHGGPYTHVKSNGLLALFRCMIVNSGPLSDRM